MNVRLAKFVRALRNQRGFSFVETLLAGGLTGAVVLGAATMLNHTAKSEKQTNVQSIIDREFAAGTQLAANSENLKPFVNAAALGACLTKDGNANCAAFGNWADYPANPGAGRPKFQVSVNHLKECTPAEPTCMATRYMRYRWICTAAECSGLETEVRITPINAYAQSFKPRTSSVKLDRRQFLTRDQITFICGSGRTMRGVDYDQLQADCQAITNSNCVTPQATLDPANPGNNCQGALTVTCPDGYATTALDNGRVVCRPPSPGRTVAGGSSTTGTVGNTYAPNGPPPTVTNTSTVTHTVASPTPAPAPAPAPTPTPSAALKWVRTGTSPVSGGPGGTASNCPNSGGNPVDNQPCTTAGATCYWAFSAPNQGAGQGSGGRYDYTCQ